MLKTDVEKFNMWRIIFNVIKLDLSYADLRSANLSDANLSSSDLRSANLSSSDLISADLSYADLRSANLSSSDLISADLRSADLSYADLSSSDLDFSQINLSCKSLYAKFDNKQTIQILYHAVKQAYNQNFENIKDDELLAFLKDEKTINIVNKFHRVKECGKI